MFDLTNLVYVVVALVAVITIHEFSHAWVANFLGDPTPQLEGRVTLNPLKHLDPLGTILIFIVGIGWGKPVRVSPAYFKKPRRDEALTALAGPASNLLMAVVFAIPLKYASSGLLTTAPWLVQLLDTLFTMSIVLFAFNMLPFPPLDGSKFVQLLIPKRFSAVYEAYLRKGSLYFLIFLLADQFFVARIWGLTVLGLFIGTIVVAIRSVIFLGI